jgi:putative thioredoxin
MNDLSPGQGSQAAGPADGLITDTTTQTFGRDVIEASRSQPVVVDFWAPWCGPCKQLGPIIEDAVRAAKGAVKLVKMNIDDHPAVAGQLGIQSIPAVIAFDQGRAVDGFVGAVPASQVKAFIDRLAGPSDEAAEIEAVLTESEAALAAGDTQSAQQGFGAVLQADPANLRAAAGLAQIAVAAGDRETAEQLLASLPEGAAKDPAIVAIRAQLTLAEQASALGDSTALEARIAADPKDFQARYDLALLANAAGDREAAADHLLEIFRRDRKWNEEGARKQLLQFFEAWGPADPATLSGRRRLSSLLFS